MTQALIPIEFLRIPGIVWEAEGKQQTEDTLIV